MARTAFLLSLAVLAAVSDAFSPNLIMRPKVLAAPTHDAGATDPSTSVRAVLMLRLPAGAKESLDAVLRDVSDPDSPLYGRYLSASQVNALTDPGTQEEVAAWAGGVGLHVESTTADAVVVSGSAELLGKALACEVRDVRSDATNELVARACTPGATVPAQLRDVVDFVTVRKA